MPLIQISENATASQNLWLDQKCYDWLWWNGNVSYFKHSPQLERWKLNFNHIMQYVQPNWCCTALVYNNMIHSHIRRAPSATATDDLHVAFPSLCMTAMMTSAMPGHTLWQCQLSNSGHIDGSGCHQCMPCRMPVGTNWHKAAQKYNSEFSMSDSCIQLINNIRNASQSHISNDYTCWNLWWQIVPLKAFRNWLTIFA